MGLLLRWKVKRGGEWKGREGKERDTRYKGVFSMVFLAGAFLKAFFHEIG